VVVRQVAVTVVGNACGLGDEFDLPIAPLLLGRDKRLSMNWISHFYLSLIDDARRHFFSALNRLVLGT